MTKYISHTHNKKLIDSSIRRARLELKDIVNKCLNNKGIIRYQNNATTVSACDFHRMLSEWRRTSSVDKAIRNLLISAFYSSEAKIGGSGIIAAMLFANMCEKISTTENATEKNVLDVIKCWQPAGVSSKVAQHAFWMGGSGCEIKLDEGKHFGTEIKCFTGIEQTGHIARVFASNLSQKFLLQEKMHAIAIDGIVESIGELHNILEESGGRRTVILARGFLPDVTNTLLENYDKKLRCIPFVVQNWCVEDFLELRKTGISCVSNDTGDIISNATLSNMIDISISLDKIIMPDTKNTKRKIMISFGEDLGALRGIALDRSKLLISLFRFTSRKGFAKLRYDEKLFLAPALSYDAAIKCSESLEKNLLSIEKIITCKTKKIRRKK